MPLGENQRRARRERARAAGALGAGFRVDAHDLTELLEVARLVVRRLMKSRDLEARLDGGIDRPRKLLDIACVGGERLRARPGLLVEFARDQQRLALQFRVGRLRGDALVFAGGAGQLAVLPVRECDLPGRLAIELVIGPAAAECFEHARRRRPFLQLQERRGRVVLRRRADLRRRRRLLDPQEIVGGRAIVLGGIRLFTLLVDRSCEVVDQRLALLVVLRRQREDLDVGLLGLRVLGELQRRVRQHRVGRAAQGRLAARIALDQLLRRRDRRPEVLHAIQVVRGRAEHGRGLLMARGRLPQT